MIRGVKANRASFVIQRGARKRQARTQERQRTVLASAGAGVSISARRAQQLAGAHGPKLSRDELDRALHAKLLSWSAKEIIHKFDTSHRGTITRLEFRQGVRDAFKLHFDNRDLDDWFTKLDKNGNDEIEMHELTHAVAALHKKSERDQREAEALSIDIESMTRKVESLEVCQTCQIRLACATVFDGLPH